MVVAAANIAEESRLLRVEERQDGGGGEISAGVQTNYPQSLTSPGQMLLYQGAEVRTILNKLGDGHQTGRR